MVILDGYFGDKLNEEPFASFLKSQDCETKIIYFECPLEVNKERVITREEARDEEKLIFF